MALLTTCLVVFGQSGLAPVVAQSLETAMIQVDGIPLFPVSSSEKLPAKQRAENVNQILQGLVNSPANATVTIDNSQALPILKVDVDNRQADLDLLTVNSKDAQGNSLQAMAVTWQAKLQTAINRGQQERANVWWLGLQSLACLGFAYLFHWLCGWFWRKRLLRLLPQATVDPITGRQPQSLQFLFKVILYLLQVLLWVGAISYIGGLLPWTRIWKNQLINTLTQTFTTPFIPAGGKSYSVLGIAVLLVSLAVIMNLAKTAQHLLRTRVLSATGLNRGAQEAVAFVANYALLFIGTLVLLQLWGFDLTSLTVFASVLGVGIGLGLQGFAKNFISGMVLIFEQPIKVGDFVKVGDYQGTVERINIRSTEIRTLDQVSIIVPNSEFLESEVVNWDHGTSISRLQIPVGIAYGSKPEAVRDALMEVASNYTGVLKNPSPRVFFTEFGESALEFILLVWINEPDKQFVIKSDLNFRIETILRDRNIEIPFPQRDLHIRSGKLPLDLPPELTASLTQLSQSLKAWLEQHPAAPGLSPQLSPTANLPPSNEGQEEQQL
jgi:small-conductance mechanosensitive channel